MNCKNCREPIEDGAAFCGNCGVALDVHAPSGKPVGSHIAQVLANEPTSGTRDFEPYSTTVAGSAPMYAIATPLQHIGETRAVLSLLLGIVGIVGALFIAVVGLVLGIAGLVLGTMSRNTPHRRLSTLGILFSSLAIVVSLGVWAYAIHKQSTASDSIVSKSQNSVASADLTTPCYSTGFIDTLNVANSKNSCNMAAYNGPSLEASTKAYKVYANQMPTVNQEVFNDFAKKALQKDVAASLPGFSIDHEEYTQFAGSPAYIVKTSDKSTGVSVTEAIVLHQVRAGANVFVLVQASTKGGADMSTLEAQWRWK